MNGFDKFFECGLMFGCEKLICRSYHYVMVYLISLLGLTVPLSFYKLVLDNLLGWENKFVLLPLFEQIFSVKDETDKII